MKIPPPRKVTRRTFAPTDKASLERIRARASDECAPETLTAQGRRDVLDCFKNRPERVGT